ncbi:MAG: Na+/H+ antiporter NhaA [Candidatus Aminicenantes bacterium]|nr:Na+/H+ antiporter NhaA [Candidatus Aminicenantes bacterium]
MAASESKNGVIAFLFENSVFLIAGAFGALVWANLDHDAYHHLVHLKLFEDTLFGTLKADGTRVFDLHYLVNDVLMAFFFAIAGKEVWEATLPGGPLSSPRRAAGPLVAAVGGMVAPAVLYLLGAALVGRFDDLSNGWAIPCATDIAFSYMVARIVFGAGHPAIPFLLLLAIADDAMGLLILAAFYPQGEVQMLWMFLAVAGVGVAFLFQRLRLHSFWWYLAIPGSLSWIGFALAGLHPALGLLPVIPAMPHHHSDRGLFDWKELEATDTLNEFEHWWQKPVELILMLFGLFNAGVLLSAVDSPTFLVLIGLLAGKPIGIWGGAMVVARGFRLGLPDGIGSRDLVVVGFAAAIGFTVALFVTTVAFPPGQIQDAAKMGALGSFVAALLTYVVARTTGIKPNPVK